MSKGETTRQAILLRATQLASVHGLDGISIGGMADAMAMSKSGVFAHFRSKEALDVAVLEYVRDRFLTDTLMPSFKAKRGVALVLHQLKRNALRRTRPDARQLFQCVDQRFERDGRHVQ